MRQEQPPERQPTSQPTQSGLQDDKTSSNNSGEKQTNHPHREKLLNRVLPLTADGRKLCGIRRNNQQDEPPKEYNN